MLNASKERINWTTIECTGEGIMYALNSTHVCGLKMTRRFLRNILMKEQPIRQHPQYKTSQNRHFFIFMNILLATCTMRRLDQALNFSKMTTRRVFIGSALNRLISLPVHQFSKDRGNSIYLFLEVI